MTAAMNDCLVLLLNKVNSQRLAHWIMAWGTSLLFDFSNETKSKQNDKRPMYVLSNRDTVIEKSWLQFISIFLILNFLF